MSAVASRNARLLELAPPWVRFPRSISSFVVRVACPIRYCSSQERLFFPKCSHVISFCQGFWKSSCTMSCLVVGRTGEIISFPPSNTQERSFLPHNVWGVQLLDMVDHSISPRELISGWFSSHATIQIGCFIL